MKIQSPNLAFTVDEFLELNDGTFQYEDRDTGRFYLEQIKWPQLVTEKFDGIRAFKENGKVYTRSGKQVPNHNTRRALEAFPLDNFDCELTIQCATFDEVQSAIMTREGYPEIQVKIFDRIMVGRAEDRVKSLDDNFERANDRFRLKNNFPEVMFDVVMPTICWNLQQLQKEGVADYVYKRSATPTTSPPVFTHRQHRRHVCSRNQRQSAYAYERTKHQGYR